MSAWPRFSLAVKSAPLTGIILIIEMTASFTLPFLMLFGGFCAMLVPTLLGNPPVYDSLRQQTLRIQWRNRTRGRTTDVTVFAVWN